MTGPAPRRRQPIPGRRPSEAPGVLYGHPVLHQSPVFAKSPDAAGSAARTVRLALDGLRGLGWRLVLLRHYLRAQRFELTGPCGPPVFKFTAEANRIKDLR